MRFIILIFFTFISSNTIAFTLENLQTEAKSKKLSEDHYWHLLLHYVPDFIGQGVTSEASHQVFFNSPKGKNNPETELKTTLTAFYCPVDYKTKMGLHPQCQFPARRKWLEQQLELTPESFPFVHCPEFEK